MALLGFLILFPVVAAVVLLCIKNDKPRAMVVYASAAIIAVASIALACAYLGSVPLSFYISSHVIDIICTIIGVAIGIVILIYAFRYKNKLAIALALVQMIGSVVFDIFFAQSVTVYQGLYVDTLSIIMALIIGIVGSGICVYALGYMVDFQAHEPEGKKDERPKFFALMFLFLGAMYLIVFSNNMVWMFTGWEITTVCSFLLIGYTKTDEAIRNSFRQINMNLVGGIAFLVALYISAIGLGTLDFNEFIAVGCRYPGLVVLPVTALALAGLTKAAQMPFHTWLLGAMVAPTPTSALLHSSTMVKAGVFLLIRLAPVFYVCMVPQLMVCFIGGFTFLMCSFLAISQSNAKRVLAYSTIANLGLITACAGVGTAEAVWAGIFLIIFHAVAKSLLFICVGTAEHHIGSRDIEDMDLLFERMPRLARFMMVGIMCMFIAPFGMLVSKWAVFMSFVDQQHFLLLVFLAFGSAATFMFWGKWLGKLAGIAAKPQNIESTVHRSEWVSIYTMVVLIALTCVGLPLVSQFVVEPYCFAIFDPSVSSVAELIESGSFISSDILWLLSIFCVILLIAFLFVIGRPGKAKKANVYLSGISVDNEQREFSNSMSGVSSASARNWYLEGIFGEKKLTPFSTLLSAAIICVAFVIAFIVFVGII